MLKERRYLIKSANYNNDSYAQERNNYSLTNSNSQNKNKKSPNPSFITTNNNYIIKNHYIVFKSIEAKKKDYNSFSDEVELSFEKNNTLLNDSNCCIKNKKIYEKILENNKRKKEMVRPVKIIKCDKINANNLNDEFFNLKKKSNHSFYESKYLSNKANKKQFLKLKTDLINTNSTNINYKNKKVVNFKYNMKDNYSFENEKFTPILSNKKDENQIILCHSIAIISQKKKKVTEKIMKKNLFTNENSELTDKIKNKGYLDSNDFMKIITEENNKKEKIINNNKSGVKEQKIKKQNKTKGKDNHNEYNKKLNENQNTFNNLDYSDKFITSNNIYNNNNRKINKNNEKNLSKEIDELNNNFHLKLSNNTKNKINNIYFQSRTKKQLSLKVLNFENNKHKLLHHKITEGQIMSKTERNGYNTKLNRKDGIKKLKKRNIIKNKGRIINVNKNNLPKEKKLLIRNSKTYKSFSNNINDIKINNKKSCHNLVFKSKNLGISLTKKIKKYYSLKNKTIEDINNNSLKNILKKKNNMNLFKLDEAIKQINNDEEYINTKKDINFNDKKRINSDIINIFNNTTNINFNSKILLNFSDNNNSPNNNNKAQKQYMNFTTKEETYKNYNNSKDVENNDSNLIKSYESKMFSEINGPNTTYFSGFNKSDLKMSNKVNLDMPINIDFEDEEDSEIMEKRNKEEIKSNKIENNEKNKLTGLKNKNKKIEILDNFIILFNNDENKEEKIIKDNNVIPNYDESLAQLNFVSKENEVKNKIMEEKLFNINNNYNLNIINNFYDDINIYNDYKEENNIKSKKFNSDKNVEFLDINNDLPNNDQDFLDNIELIQKNNFIYKTKDEIKNNEENKNENETIKELETENEFNVNEEKCSEALQKYEKILNFGKINPF